MWFLFNSFYEQNSVSNRHLQDVLVLPHCKNYSEKRLNVGEMLRKDRDQN